MGQLADSPNSSLVRGSPAKRFLERVVAFCGLLRIAGTPSMGWGETRKEGKGWLLLETEPGTVISQMNRNRSGLTYIQDSNTWAHPDTQQDHQLTQRYVHAHRRMHKYKQDPDTRGCSPVASTAQHMTPTHTDSDTYTWRPTKHRCENKFSDLSHSLWSCLLPHDV